MCLRCMHVGNNPLHVYIIQEDYFDPEFLKAVKYAKSDHATPDGLMELLREEDGMPHTLLIIIDISKTSRFI